MKPADQELHYFQKRKKSYAQCAHFTPGRQQSKLLLAITERGPKIAINSVFDCHLSPVGRQMAITNSISNDFYLHLSIVLVFLIAAYPVCIWFTCDSPP